MTLPTFSRFHSPLLLCFAVISLMASEILIHLPSQGSAFQESLRSLQTDRFWAEKNIETPLPDATLYFQVQDSAGQNIKGVRVSGRVAPDWSYSTFNWETGNGVAIHFSPGVLSISPGLLIYWNSPTGEAQSVLAWIAQLKPGDHRTKLIRMQNGNPIEIQEVDREGDFRDRLERLRG